MFQRVGSSGQDMHMVCEKVNEVGGAHVLWRINFSLLQGKKKFMFLRFPGHFLVLITQACHSCQFSVLQQVETHSDDLRHANGTFFPIEGLKTHC